MNSPFIIRPARSSEKSRLLTLFEELDELHRRALPHIFRKPPDAAGRERSIPDGWMDGPDSIVLVAVRQGWPAWIGNLSRKDARSHNCQS